MLASSGSLQSWFKLLRIHQWSKNALVFVPIVTAHRFDLVSISQATVAFFAFSVAASGIYIVNDWFDRESDREHRTKKRRPLASGVIRVPHALIVAFALIAAAVLGASMLSPRFGLVLLGYLSLSTAYIFFLKQKLIADV